MNTKAINIMAGVSLAVVTFLPMQANADPLNGYSNENVIAQNYNNNRWRGHDPRWGQYGSFFNGIDQKISMLSVKIDRGQQSGRLTGREASKLRNSLNGVSRLAAKMRNSGRGYNNFEINTLNNRLASVDTQINRELADRQGRWNRPF